jgi:hypothetical protein
MVLTVQWIQPRLEGNLMGNLVVGEQGRVQE